MSTGHYNYQAELADCYDRAAELYRRDDDQDVHRADHQRRGAILERLCANSQRPVRVLDLGCGTGRYFHCLKNLELLVGADLSPGMLGQAKRPVGASADGQWNRRLLREDMDALAFTAGSFDVIYSFGVFGRGTTLTPEFAQRLHTWLTPGGSLYFDAVETETVSWSAKFSRKLMPVLFPWSRRRRLQRDLSAIPVAGHSREAVGALLANAGFADVLIEPHVCRDPFFTGSVLEFSAGKPAGTASLAIERAALSQWLNWPQQIRL